MTKKEIEILRGLKESQYPDVILVEDKEYPLTEKNLEIANNYLKSDNDDLLKDLDSFTDVFGKTHEDIINSLSNEPFTM